MASPSEYRLTLAEALRSVLEADPGTPVEDVADAVRVLIDSDLGSVVEYVDGGMTFRMGRTGIGHLPIVIEVR